MLFLSEQVGFSVIAVILFALRQHAALFFRQLFLELVEAELVETSVVLHWSTTRSDDETLSLLVRPHTAVAGSPLLTPQQAGRTLMVSPPYGLVDSAPKHVHVPVWFGNPFHGTLCGKLVEQDKASLSQLAAAPVTRKELRRSFDWNQDPPPSRVVSSFPLNAWTTKTRHDLLQLFLDISPGMGSPKEVMLSRNCRILWGSTRQKPVEYTHILYLHTFKFLAKLLYCSMSSGLTDLRARPRASYVMC